MALGQDCATRAADEGCLRDIFKSREPRVGPAPREGACLSMYAPSKRRDSAELVGGRSATGTCRARRASLNSLASVESQGVGPAFHPASILPFGLSRLTSIGKETVDPASDFQA